MDVTLRIALSVIAAVTLPVAASAQDRTPAEEKWAIGAGAAFIQSPYAGEGTRVRPFPLVSYSGERVFLLGLSGGVHLYRSDALSVDAMLGVRLDGFDISDLGRAELRANGLEPALLEDRDDGVDAGFRATYRFAVGSVTLGVVRDIADVSDGTEIVLDYAYTWRFDRAALTASAGASWMSRDLTGYYYGILSEEAARGARAYTPDDAFVPRVALTLTHPIGSSKWLIQGAAQLQFLPEELTDSPLLERDQDTTARLVLGVSRRF